MRVKKMPRFSPEFRSLPGWPVKVLLCLMALFSCLTPTGAGAELFPVYPAIKPNVAFWKDIYSRYDSTQGVLHDRRELDLVYTVLEVENTWDNAARRRNRAVINAAREQYRAALLHLATGQAPRNAREKQVRELFGDRASPERLRRAAENIRFQRGLKDRFQAGVIRSGAYLRQIKEILRHYGVPEDLAYLPHVESSFNYEAYSRLGAAGIWQFMRATGRQYLKIDYELDERRDPIRATHAAARLLLDNHRRLGDWPLAITAYNHGPTGMLRARRRHGDYPAIFQHYDGNRFGFASRNFYAEFLAAREVAKNYRRYFGPLELEPERRSHEVVLGGYVPLAKLAAHLGLEVDTLRAYNQGLREPVLRGEKYVPRGYRLRVPADPATVRRAAALPAAIMEDAQRRSAFHMVRRGDTAWEIARRHGVSLGALRAANQLDSRATIYAGQNLRIPGVEEPVTMAAVADDPDSRAVPSRVATAVAVAGEVEGRVEGEPGAAPAAGSAPGVGESDRGSLPVVAVQLASARDNDWSLAVAGEAAEGGPGLLGTRTALALSGHAGRLPTREKIGGAGDPDPLAVNPAVVWGNLPVEETDRDADGRLVGYIRVEVEETLGHYADWLGIATQELRRLNGLPFGRPIRLNQRLRIPLEQVDQAAFEERRYEYHKGLEEDFYAAFRVAEVESRRVRPGDNIWALSRDEFELPLWLLRKYNPQLEMDRLQPGDEIRVPVLVRS